VAHHDLVAIGASAGGISALKRIVAALPADLPATLLVTLHVHPHTTSILPDILAKAGPLPAAFAKDGEPMRRGRIYVAPPDLHLLVEGERLLLRRGPIENGMRPAIDPLFRSVAASVGGRAIGVVLTGYLNDGSSGLRAIKQCGGITVVQDPDDAEVPDMPRHALAATQVDHVVPVADMAPLLRRLVAEPAARSEQVPEDIRREVLIAAQRKTEIATVEQLGERSVLSCPECNGVLWEIKEGELVRYRCHLGHAYGLDALASAQIDKVDRALSSALRALEERIHVIRRLENEARQARRERLAKNWEARARDYEHQAAAIRNILLAERTGDSRPHEAVPEPDTGRVRGD
jgi:two-component system chemotaxis response regulator CheB